MGESITAEKRSFHTSHNHPRNLRRVVVHTAWVADEVIGMVAVETSYQESRPFKFVSSLVEYSKGIRGGQNGMPEASTGYSKSRQC